MQQRMLTDQIGQVRAQLAIEQRQVGDLSALLQRLQALGTKGYVSALDIQQQRTQELDAEGQVKSLARQRSESEQQLKSVAEAWILKDYSFEVAAGESVAIVGQSGCGKSTLARLLLGLLDPQEGKITIGGIDLKYLGKDRYRTIIGSVMQDDQLFAGSIADNIAFFDEVATQEAIEEAARQAELHQDIVAMPMGYHSLVGDMGSSLSGGQQQRLALARALYRKPRILVLDEATSHLDVERERQIAETLRKLQVTRIVIAHRPETIASAERVLALDKGKIRATKPTIRDSGEDPPRATAEAISPRKLLRT